MNLRDLLADIRQNCSGIPADWIQFDVKYLTEITASIEKSLANRCRNCRHWADNTDDDIGALAADGPTHPMDAWPDLIVPSELRALVERVAELEAKLSAYENAPTIGVIRDVGSRPYCDWKVSQSTLPKSGAEIIARPTFKDKP